MERAGRRGPAIADFRAALHAWLDAHARRARAAATRRPGTLDEQIAQMQRVKSILFDAGWMRYGWPERVGGLGGSPMLRTELGAALAARDLADPGPLLARSRCSRRRSSTSRRPRSRPRSCRACSRARRCGARGSRSPAPAATSRRCGCRAVPDGDAGDRVDVGDQRPEGVDEPGAVLRPLRAADAHRPGRVAPPRHHRVLRRHGHARHHGRAARDDQRRARVRRGVLRRRRRPRRPDARRGATAAGRSR